MNSPTVIQRHAAQPVLDAMTDTRIIALVGPRQSGKTTLSQLIADQHQLTYLTLDNSQTRRTALDDPTGLIRSSGDAVIDEIQRAPELILTLKQLVDHDNRPGQFLITGSVDLFRGTVSPDSLAGRVEAIELLPLSQAEMENLPPSDFVERAFRNDFISWKDTGPTSDLLKRIVTGGYPEAVARSSPNRRQKWLKAYAHALSTRDIQDLSSVDKTDELSSLLEHAALASGQLLNYSSIASALGVNRSTVERWLVLLEQMFILRRVRAWHRNESRRLIKTPKLHFLDSGLLCALRNLSVEDIRTDRNRLGDVLESFVYSELLKMISLMSGTIRISHYRDKAQNEIDFVLEQAGKLVGIEVKSTASLKPAHFNGLRQLREATGSAFVSGIILHDGDRIQRFDENLYGMPMDQLWSPGTETPDSA